MTKHRQNRRAVYVSFRLSNHLRINGLKVYVKDKEVALWRAGIHKLPLAVVVLENEVDLIHLCLSPLDGKWEFLQDVELG